MVNILRQSDLFHYYTTEELSDLSAFFSRRKFGDGQYLIKDGLDSQALYFIEMGKARVLKRGKNGCDSHFTDLSQGAMVGGLAFFGEGKNPVHVVAHGELVVLELSFAAVKEITEQNVLLGLKLHQSIGASISQEMKKTILNVGEALSSSHLACLGHLMASLTHDINNPLGTILLLSSQLADEASKEKPNLEKVMKAKEGIDLSFGFILRVMEGVKLASRNVQDDPLEYTDIQSLIETTVTLCQGKLRNSGVDVQICVEPNDLKVFCRPTEISKVILNLISNAHDAVENLSQRWIRVQVHEQKGFCEISVIDSGGGISPPMQEKIFSPFFSTKERGKGTGIGLSITKKIIESYKGQFFLDTNSKNTRFVIRIPESAAQLTEKLARVDS